MLKKIVTAAAVAGLFLTGCGANGTDDGPTSTGGGTTGAAAGGELTLWHYEGANSAMGIAWAEAIKIFEEETGATVTFEEKAFEQIRSTASQVLNSNEAPDLMEFNKGNATAGLLASQGLLADISDAVAEYGWDEKLAPSLQTTAKYNENGVMGSGPWYGIPNYGEFVTVYYNKAMFEEAGLEIPTTYDEFIAVMDAFVAEGVAPLATAGLEYPLGQLWYQLALSQADRQWVNDYQLYENPLDWNGEPVNYATNTLVEYLEKGYFSKDVAGIKAEDAGLAFMNGTSPMFVSGSWWYGRFVDEIEGFEFGIFPFPDSTLAPGSSGNLWVVPENAQDKDLAYKFIDITMRPEIQAILGNNGGLPVAADVADITDPKSLELIQAFNALNEQDGLSFYPDWPTPTFYDVIVAQLQELVNGTKTPAQVQEGLAAEYNAYVDEIS